MRLRELDLLVDAVAVYRLTRLATADTILDGPRDAIVEAAYVAAGRAEAVRNEAEHFGWSDYAETDSDAPKMATLVVCRWCAGMWIAFGVVVLRRFVPRAWRPLAHALVFSAVAALLARLEDG